MHPDSLTLGDFRAPTWLLEYEAEALREAEQIVTPHSAVGKLFGAKAMLLPWEMPPTDSIRQPKNAANQKTVLFLGPTVGRKGAYEVREAALRTGTKVLIGGRQLEGPDFWRGVDTALSGPNWMTAVDAVVAPSIVESQPRKLLCALAAGVPVIATPACGLGNLGGVSTIPSLDPGALAAAIEKV